MSAAAGQQRAIRGKRHTIDIAGMPARPAQGAADYIPEFDRTIPTSTDQCALIRAEGKRPDPFGVGLPDVIQDLAACLPHAYFPATAGSRPIPFGAADSDTVDGVEVVGKAAVLNRGSGETGVLHIHALEVGLPNRYARKVETAQIAAQQPQQVDDVARPIVLLNDRLVAPGGKQGQELSLQRIRTASRGSQSLQQRRGDHVLLALSYMLPGGGLDERKAVQQVGLPIDNLVVDSLHQLIGHVFEDDRLQGKGWLVQATL